MENEICIVINLIAQETTFVSTFSRLPDTVFVLCRWKKQLKNLATIVVQLY